MTFRQHDEPLHIATHWHGFRWDLGTRVRKVRGSSWQGRIVGFYATDLTPEGYAVESEREPGSVQIYPAAALELVTEIPGPSASAQKTKQENKE